MSTGPGAVGSTRPFQARKPSCSIDEPGPGGGLVWARLRAASSGLRGAVVLGKYCSDGVLDQMQQALRWDVGSVARPASSTPSRLTCAAMKEAGRPGKASAASGWSAHIRDFNRSKMMRAAWDQGGSDRPGLFIAAM